VQTYRFDINARTGQEVSRQQVNAMLRTLLEERFRLVVATEQRQRNAYSLRLVRADGRLGPDLRKAAEGCESIRPRPVLTRPSSAAQGSDGNACSTI
jgi:uncharacterized protein (TIGR03435 family)